MDARVVGVLNFYDVKTRKMILPGLKKIRKEVLSIPFVERNLALFFCSLSIFLLFFFFGS